MDLKSQTNCYGQWEGNLLQHSDATCQQICQQIPTCRAAVVNKDGYCYIKGNHDKDNKNMTCVSSTDRSYVKK